MRPRTIVLRLCALLFLAAAVALMAAHLASDSMGKSKDLHDTGLNFDPPSKCHNARNMVLFGTWDTDEWDPYIHSPIHTISQTAVFGVFGVGYVQMRVVSVALTAISMWLTFLISSRSLGEGWGLVSLGISVVCFPFIVFGHSGLLEPYLIFFMLLSTWCLARSYEHAEKEARRASLVWLALAALAAACTFLSKPIGIYYVAAFLLLVLLHPPRKQVGTRGVAFAFALLPVILYLIFGWIVSAEHFHRESSYWLSRAALHNLSSHWIRQPLVATFRRQLLPVILLCLPALYMTHRLFLRERIRARHIPLVLMSLTMLLGSQFLGFVDYRPIRYYIPLLAPAFILATSLAAGLYRWIRDPREITLSGWVKPIFWWATASFALKFGLIDPMVWRRYLPHGITPWMRMAIATGLALILLFAIRLLGRRLTRVIASVNLVARKTVYFVLAIPLLYYYVSANSDCLRHWVKHPRYTQRNVSRYLGEHFRGVVVAGSSPLFAVMENEHRALKVTKYNLNWPWMNKDRTTHLLIPRINEHDLFFRHTFPEVMKQAKLLDTFEVAGLDHKLYAVNPAPLEFAIGDDNPRNSLRVEITNPDPHSPQRASLVAIARSSHDAQWVKVVTAYCEPLGSCSASIDLSERVGSHVAVYALPNDGWVRASDCPTSHGKTIDDMTARGLQALIFNPPGKKHKSEFAGSLLGVRDIPQGDIAVAVSLRGDVSKTDMITLAWIEENGAIQEIEIPPESISRDSFGVFAFTAKAGLPERGGVELRFRGGGSLFASGVFLTSIEEDFLNRESLWHTELDISE